MMCPHSDNVNAFYAGITGIKSKIKLHALTQILIMLGNSQIDRIHLKDSSI